MLTTLQKHIMPRRRIGNDPLLPIATDQRFAPITIARMRVTTPVKKRILAVRHPIELSFTANLRLSVIIPFRNREQHLDRLLPILRKILTDQQINYRIIIVEQTKGKLFNKGTLLNVGAHYTWDMSDYFCFHDVDMLPAFAEYNCPSQPFRLVSLLNYSYRNIDRLEGSNFGGVVSLKKEHLKIINGFSNRFQGWGQEDDDLFFRCLLKGLVPFEDRHGTFDDLDTPEPEVTVKKQVIKQGSNKRLKSKIFRLVDDPHGDGMNELHYNILNEHKGQDLWHIRVEI